MIWSSRKERLKEVLTLIVGDTLPVSRPLHCSDAGKPLPGVRTMKRVAVLQSVAHSECQESRTLQ